MKIDKNIVNAIVKTTEALFANEAKRATKYLGPKLVVRATHRNSNKDEFVKGRTQVLVTFGAPNFHEKEFIQSWLKAGKRFPVQNVQLKIVEAKK